MCQDDNDKGKKSFWGHLDYARTSGAHAAFWGIVLQSCQAGWWMGDKFPMFLVRNIKRDHSGRLSEQRRYSKNDGEQRHIRERLRSGGGSVQCGDQF